MNEARGFETMSPAMSKIHRYYDWLYDAVRPYLGQSVLEIGPGYGSMAERILKDRKEYRAIDTDAGVIVHMTTRFPQLGPDRLTTGSITDVDLAARLKSQRPDSLLSMNVLEHIEDDAAHLKSLARSAVVDRFVFIVPAMQCLYGSFDSQAGHYRRYDRAAFRKALETAGMRVRHLSYFNGMGALSWWVATKVLKMPLNDQRSDRAIIAYDSYFIPAAHLADPLLRPFIGQSLIAVASLS